MTAEAGHHASRSYFDQDGAFHLNGAAFFNDGENDIADQLEELDTIAAADLTKIDGITNGTVAANKAVVVDANLHQDVLKATAIYIGASGSAVQVTATAAELNYCDVTTLGVVEASKAVTADANGKIGLLRLGSAAASASGLLMGVGTSAAPAATATAGANLVEIRGKTTATSGDNRLGYFRYDVGGAGASGECLRAFTDLTAAAGTARGAHVSLQAGATGYVTGLGVGVDAQLYVKNEAVAAGGTYYAGQSDVYFAGSTGSLAGVTKHAIHHFQTSGDATGQATCVNVWAVDATSAADATKAISSVSLAELPSGTVGIAVLINGTRYYIPAVVATEWN